MSDSQNSNLVAFEKAWLKNYAIVDKTTGKLKIQVKGRPFLYTNEETERSAYIVNLKAIRKSDLPKLKELFAGRDSVSADEMNPYILSTNIFINDGVEPVIPMANETVEAEFGMVENRAGEMILACTGIRVKEAVEAKKIDIDALFSESGDVDPDIEEVADIFDEDEK